MSDYISSQNLFDILKNLRQEQLLQQIYEISFKQKLRKLSCISNRDFFRLQVHFQSKSIQWKKQTQSLLSRCDKYDEQIYQDYCKKRSLYQTLQFLMKIIKQEEQSKKTEQRQQQKIIIWKHQENKQSQQMMTEQYWLDEEGPLMKLQEK